jgi:hypothetical protein
MHGQAGYGVRGEIRQWGNSRALIVIVGLVAAFAFWSFPVPTVRSGYDAVQSLTFLLHLCAVLCLVLALFCAVNLILRSIERNRLPRA